MCCQLGAEVVGLDFVLLHQIDGRKDARAVKAGFGVDAAIEIEDVGIDTGAVDRDELIVVTRVCDLGKEIWRANTGNKLRKAVGITAINGQVDNGLVIQDLPERGRFGFELRTGFCDRERLRSFANLHVDVLLKCLTNVQHQMLCNKASKSRLVDLQRVSGRGQQWKRI